MRKGILFAAALTVALVLKAHVTPNVVLVRRGDFVKASLPGATRFFEKAFSAPALAAVRSETGWMPSGDDTKIYVGREESGRLVGTVVFLWMPSQHGPAGIGVAFGPDGRSGARRSRTSAPSPWSGCGPCCVTACFRGSRAPLSRSRRIPPGSPRTPREP